MSERDGLVRWVLPCNLLGLVEYQNQPPPCLPKRIKIGFVNRDEEFYSVSSTFMEGKIIKCEGRVNYISGNVIFDEDKDISRRAVMIEWG